jgi:hypothetical protein
MPRAAPRLKPHALGRGSRALGSRPYPLSPVHTQTIVAPSRIPLRIQSSISSPTAPLHEGLSDACDDALEGRCLLDVLGPLRGVGLAPCLVLSALCCL